MTRNRISTAGVLACLFMVLASCQVWAETPPDPLRLVPEQTDVVLVARSPRQALEAITQLDQFKDFLKLEPVKEILDSTNIRRLFQLVAYFEKKLGNSWPVILDQVGGGGVVLALRFAPDPAPALIVIQGTDENSSRSFLHLAAEVIDQEIARQEGKERVEKRRYRKIPTLRVGKDLHAAQAGSAIVVSNSKDLLHQSLDRHLDMKKKSLATNPRLVEARKLLPANPLAWGWLNLEPLHQSPDFKEFFALPRDQPILTLGVGGWLDVARRSPYLCAALERKPEGLAATIRMPRGRKGMPSELAVHLPPAGDGALPLLEPKGVLLSHSFFIDGAKFWQHRAKLLNDQQVKGLEEFDKTTALFLLGNRLSKLLTQAGSHVRVVAANQPSYGNRGKLNLGGTALPIPAFAIVVDMRQPEEFTRTMNLILRGAAGALYLNQIKLHLTEEKHGEYVIVGYRFWEKEKVPVDVNNIRFNFSPCFVRVGDQFVVSSTIELGHELVGILSRETKKHSTHLPAVRTRIYAAGAADLLEGFQDQLFAQAILGQALSPEAAKSQTKAVIDLVRRLGILEAEGNYNTNDFRYDIRLALRH